MGKWLGKSGISKLHSRHVCRPRTLLRGTTTSSPLSPPAPQRLGGSDEQRDRELKENAAAKLGASRTLGSPLVLVRSAQLKADNKLTAGGQKALRLMKSHNFYKSAQLILYLALSPQGVSQHDSIFCYVSRDLASPKAPAATGPAPRIALPAAVKDLTTLPFKSKNNLFLMRNSAQGSDIFLTALFWTFLWTGGYRKMGWGSVADDNAAVSCPAPCDMSLEDSGSVRGWPRDALMVTCGKRVQTPLQIHLSPFRLLSQSTKSCSWVQFVPLWI